MKQSEVNQLLETIGEFFPIAITTSKVKSWHNIIGHLEYRQAAVALNQCLQESEYMPKPADILRRVPKKIDIYEVSNEEGEYLERIRRAQSNRTT